jgi:eukaryotic-like serine/threonine-protein kinase
MVHSLVETIGPGSRVGEGRYLILRLLGRGGMGSVFEAKNTLTHKRVAIKGLHSAQAGQPQAIERLVREAQASARVSHPNVVDVYDVVRDGDAVFLVMEYLDGEPLSSALAPPGLPLHKLIALLIPAMRGVAAAHRQGVIHRDIKPDNIFLAREDDNPQPVAKVLDFGISKLEPRGLDQVSLTRTGGTLGTPLYMSFEQLQGESDLDARTDVYAFGVILYEAITGQLPYRAETLAELVVKLLTVPPQSPKVLRPELPGSLARLVLWAIAREREQRIPDLETLIRELEPFASELGLRAAMTLNDDDELALIDDARAPGPLAGLPRAAVVGTASALKGDSRDAVRARGELGKRRGRVLLGVTGVALLLTLALSGRGAGNPGAGTQSKGTGELRAAAVPMLPALPVLPTVRPASLEVNETPPARPADATATTGPEQTAAATPTQLLQSPTQVTAAVSANQVTSAAPAREAKKKRVRVDAGKTDPALLGRTAASGATASPTAPRELPEPIKVVSETAPASTTAPVSDNIEARRYRIKRDPTLLEF